MPGQAITWSNTDVSWTTSNKLQWNLNQNFLSRKCIWTWLSSAIWRPFCSSLSVLKQLVFTDEILLIDAVVICPAVVELTEHKHTEFIEVREAGLVGEGTGIRSPVSIIKCPVVSGPVPDVFINNAIATGPEIVAWKIWKKTMENANIFWWMLRAAATCCELMW